MKTRLLFFILIILLPVSSYSQGGAILRRALNRQIDREVDTLVDKKIQEQNNNAAQQQNEAQTEQKNESNEAAEKSENSEGGANMSGLFGNKVTMKYSDEYNFTSRLFMKVENYDKKEVTKADMYMYYSAASPNVGIETKSITSDSGEDVPVTASMVLDGENKCFIALTDVNNMKMGMISAVPDENTITTDKNGKPRPKPVITKTGNSRVIVGYKCDEYLYKDEYDKTSGKLWHSKEADLKIDKRSWSRTGMTADYYGYEGFNEGIILASEIYDDKDKLKSKTETVEITPDFPHSITVKGYTLRQVDQKKK
jgi:hypothetical protein